MNSDDRSRTIEWLREALARHERPLIAYATRIIGDAERARDVVQDTFLKLWKVDPASVDGHVPEWLYTVCRNRALDVRRKEGRMTTLSESTAAKAAAADMRPAGVAKQEGGLQLFAAIDTLPERQKEVLRLKFQGGLSYREISAVMDTTVSNVGVLTHTAIKTLRERLGAGDPAPDVRHTAAR